MRHPLPIALTASAGLATALCRMKGASCERQPPEPLTPREDLQVPSMKLVVDGRLNLRMVCTLLQRCFELLLLLGPSLLCSFFRRTPLLGCLISQERMLSMLVTALARCGPVGIKWGQWASTRYDLFDDQTCLAFGTLTNHAPTHSFEWSRQLIEKSFDRPLDDIFETFDREVLSGVYPHAACPCPTDYVLSTMYYQPCTTLPTMHYRWHVVHLIFELPRLIFSLTFPTPHFLASPPGSREWIDRAGSLRASSDGREGGCCEGAAPKPCHAAGHRHVPATCRRGSNVIIRSGLTRGGDGTQHRPPAYSPRSYVLNGSYFIAEPYVITAESAGV